MPSIKRFFFPKKKNQGHKLQEFHCYDNLRNSAYFLSPPPPPLPPHQMPPPMQHSFNHHPLHQLQQPPPQHHHHHQQQPMPQHQQQPQQARQPPLHPQLQVSPQLPTVTPQCHCPQCSYQQQQQQQQQPHHHHQPSVVSPNFSNCMSNGTLHHQQVPHVQQLVPTQQPQQVHHQPLPIVSSQPSFMLQPMQNCVQPQVVSPYQLQQPQQYHIQTIQHQQLPQHQQQSCNYPEASNAMMQPMSPQQSSNFVIQGSSQNQPSLATPGMQTQCTCQHCPYQQQHPDSSQSQHPVPQQTPQQQPPPPPSQPHQAITGQQMQQFNSMAQTTNGNCQAQIYSNSYYNLTPANQYNSMSPPQQQQYHTFGHQPIYQQQTMPPTMLGTTTPRMQQQTPKQTLECHTIQPQSYQQQKQQYQQQTAQSQNHQRVQSLNHQQQQQPMIHTQQQFNQAMVKSSHELQSETAEPQLELDGNSRYANLAPRQSPEPEHIYCNESKKLPEYRRPPSYAEFMASKNQAAYEFGRARQHMTHLSESVVCNRSRESGYENLRSGAYGNIGGFRQVAGQTS